MFGWSDWEISLLAEFFSKDPGPDRRLEIGIARLGTMYANAHKAKNKAAYKVEEFLPFDRAWKGPEDQSIGDLAKTFSKVKIGKRKG